MEQLNWVDWATLPPMALMALTMLGVFWFLWKLSQGYATIQANALKAGSEAIERAIDALKDTQAESRVFYTSKLEDMRSGMRVLEDRMRELDEQLEDKNHRIEDLERENKRKDARIQELEEEVGILRKRLDEKSKPRSKPLAKGKGATVVPGADK